MSDEAGGCIGYLLGTAIIIGLIILVIMYIIGPVLIAVASIGGVYGGAVSIGNYGKSFINNVIKK